MSDPPPHLRRLVGEGLVVRRVVVSAAHAVLVKALVEAHEGVANVFAERGGELTLASPADRERDLDALVESIHELVSGSSKIAKGRAPHLT